uniref:EGF-like domain-containing protein n=1 Tax=Anas platyrhynchos platyrhynchos TaxID=8840 RepID=A0A493TN29_ANAPP
MGFCSNGGRCHLHPSSCAPTCLCPPAFTDQRCLVAGGDFQPPASPGGCPCPVPRALSQLAEALLLLRSVRLRRLPAGLRGDHRLPLHLPLQEGLLPARRPVPAPARGPHVQVGSSGTAVETTPCGHLSPQPNLGSIRSTAAPPSPSSPRLVHGVSSSPSASPPSSASCWGPWLCSASCSPPPASPCASAAGTRSPGGERGARGCGGWTHTGWVL